MRTVVIRNNSSEEKIWLKAFAPNEEYQIPTDNSLVFKYSTLDVFLAAIVSGEASIGNGTVFFDSINDQINWLKDIDNTPKDADGATIIRSKAAKAGWTYHLTAPEFTTATINSLYHTDVQGTALNEAVIKFYDINNVELTTQQDCDTSCVKTVLTFEPPWDFEIIGGTIKTAEDVTADVRLWVIAVPDVPAAYGGSKVMVQNVNLKFVDPNNGIEADGRASKFMPYSATYHTNKLQLTVKHPAGSKTDMMMAFELFRV